MIRFIIPLAFLWAQGVNGFHLERYGSSLMETFFGKHHHHHHHGGHDDDTVCESTDWRKKALKLVVEFPAAGLFDNLRNQTKFEASSVSPYGDGFAVVFDNLHDIGFFGASPLQALAPGNVLKPTAGLPKDEDSEYEGVTPRTRTGTLLAVNEGVEQRTTEGSHWKALVRELATGGEKEPLQVVRDCPVDYELSEGDKKGFEGAHYIDGGDAGEFLLLLCEGNFCEGKKGRGKEAGNGRIVVAKFDAGNDTASCAWRTEKVLAVPETADFTDFSDLDVEAPSGVSRIVVATQENAALWIGLFDQTALEFVGEGEVVHFPRTGDCLEVYCNIEGVAFIDGNRVVTATDRAKSNQPWRCVAHDQSIQVFALPYNNNLWPSGSGERADGRDGL